MSSPINATTSTVTPRPTLPTASSPATSTSKAVVAGDKLALSPSAAPTFKTDGLSAEEIQYVREGLLPANYSDLKACMQSKGLDAAIQMAREGKTGPFSDGYGDPKAMLDGARRIQANPQLLSMAQTLKKGDILLETYNKPDDFISQVTAGPFVHALICTGEAPPEFIEAVGITGSENDPTTDRVRRTTLGEHAYDSMSYRIVRPTDGMPATQANSAVSRAIAFSESQLGKPYNYSFSDKSGGSSAAYCSELTYQAYTQGAGVDLKLKKSPERDEMMVALTSVVDALQPDNKLQLVDETMRFLKRDPKPTQHEFVAYLVDSVLPNCQTTKGIATNPADRQKLQGMLEKILNGQAFPHFDSATRAYQEAEKRGDFKTPVIGFLRREEAQSKIGADFVSDNFTLIKDSGASLADTASALTKVLTAALPYSETLSAYFTGPHSTQTKDAGRALDSIDWLKSHVPHLPLVGQLGIQNLPSRAKPKVDMDFISPTDLAWSDMTHFDFNAQPGHPLDQWVPKQDR